MYVVHSTQEKERMFIVEITHTQYIVEIIHTITHTR